MNNLPDDWMERFGREARGGRARIPEPVKRIKPALRDDICAHGLRHPEIATLEGKILDGRHRYRACGELSIKPTFKAFEAPPSKRWHS